MSSAATTRAPMSSAHARGGAPAVGGSASIDPVRLLKKYYLLLICAAVAGGVIGTVAHFILARVSPMYTASATFSCNAMVRGPGDLSTQDISQDEINRFMGTQIAIMTSSPVLQKVLDDPDVGRTSWAAQYTVKGRVQTADALPELEKSVSVRIVPQTNLIRASMTWRKPEDVRTIVEALQKVYQNELRSNSASLSSQRREVLGRQINELEQAIKDLNERRNRILQANNIADIEAGIGALAVQDNEFSQRRVTTIAAIEATDSQFTNYRDMQERDVISYPDNIREQASHDPVILDQDQRISQYRTNYQSLKLQGFGDEHPTVIAAKRMIEASNQERQEAFDRTLRKLFDGEVDALRTQTESLRATLKKIDEELVKIDTRKQDLVQRRLDLKDIDNEVRLKTEERSQKISERQSIEVLLGSPVFDRVKLVVPAQTPQNMSFPKLTILVPLGVVLITGLTAGLVLLREVLDQRVRGPADLAAIARIRVLGLVSDAQEDPARPANLATAFRDAPTGVTAESFRLLRAPIVKAMDQAGHKSLLVLAGMPGSGATTVATNLGLACAGAEERVLVIDANLRRPGVQKAFGLPDGPGLGDVLAGATKFDDAVRPTSAENLYVLTVGSSANRTMPERLASEAMARVLNEAKGKFDRVIIDSAPAIVSGDGFALANRVDAVALVVRALSEKRGLVARLRNQLGECRGEFLGVVVNAVRASAGGYLRGNIKATHEYQHGSQAA